MKEYTINLSFSIKSEKSNIEKIIIFAEELSEKIMEKENLIYDNGVEIVDVNVEDVLDLNNYDFDEDEELFDEDEDY